MNYFIQGIKNPAYDVVIISAKDYPVLAQQRKFEFKALLEGRLTACERCVMVMDFHEGRGHVSGRGGSSARRGRSRVGPYDRCGGRGRNGGAGRGSGGRGNGRSQFHTTHKTTVGGVELDKTNLSDGYWAVESIADGQVDDVCELHSHIVVKTFILS